MKSIMQRREFIKRSAALASVTAVGIAEAEPIAREPLSEALRCKAGIVLVDERFSDSKAFAAAFAARGAKVLSLEEDIGRLWYGELRAHCFNAGGLISGLTVHTDLFVSQQFAKECGRTFIEYGAHDCRGRRTMTHSLPESAALDLRRCESWAEAVAVSLLRSQSCSAERVLQYSRAVRASDHPGSLYSWILT